jgi:DNA-binding CsgD family transcriptional regulator
MSQGSDRRTTLLGRRSECDALDAVLADAFAGRSRAIILRGEPGVGKSALLGYLSDRAAAWHLVTAVGVESEMELAYSGLHQLCAPMLDRLDRLPVPQRDALATVFGRSSGPAPDRFLVGLATLTLLAEVAEQQPLLCVVDDVQWLDRVSVQILGFVARRLLADRVALVCGARTGTGDDVLVGLPELVVGGLVDSDARALLLAHLYGPLDVAVCDQIIAECHGNPLALMELPRAWNAAELAGGFGLPGSRPVVSRIEQSYARRLHLLPADTQLLALAAAAEPLGDLVLLHRAAVTLGLDMAAAGPAVDAGLLEVDRRVEFAHPLARSAIYRSATATDRHRVHRALAEATDAETDADRRAWHRARATSGPGEDVADELERSAGRAQARGGLAAAAAFLQRAVALTVDPTRRAQRALAAAEASLQAGAFDATLALLATADAGPLDKPGRAQLDLVRGNLAFVSGRSREAPPLLLQAATRLVPFEPDLARETYAKAWAAAALAGAHELREISLAARALPPRPGDPRPVDLLLDGLALVITDGRATAAATLLRAGRILAAADISVEDSLRWGWLASSASALVWDFEGMLAISARQVELIRGAGALAQLPFHLAVLGSVTAWSGDFPGAASLIAEAESVAAVTGSPMAPPFGALRLLALQGAETETSMLVAKTVEQATAAGQGTVVRNAHWAAAVLYNGLCRYDEAAAAAKQATSGALDMYDAMWALPELVEAATRTGDIATARNALARLAVTTRPCGTDFAVGIEARCRALLSPTEEVEDRYREAIGRFSRTQLRPELARAQLLYGEWLRREDRRVDARQQLRSAHDMFATIGMEAFAERASRELLATGEKVRKRTAETRVQLTPQEEQIARLARDGLSNPEIGAQLFISARTVEWHLRNLFLKLGISSRRQLPAALSKDGRHASIA